MQHGYDVTGRSWAQLAEALVRTGSGGIEWEGMRLASHFQPIYCVRSCRSHGFEALVRATDAAGAVLRPDELFDATPPAKRVLLDWTLRAMHLRNFARVDPGDRMLFLNVHPEAVVSESRGGRELGELIRYYGLAPKRVCIEVLEAECADEALLRAGVSAYRALGISIAMDDFGAARSNFDRIVRLRPEIVKIDRSLLADAVVGELRARRMLCALVELLHETNARVAIEGIENDGEARVALESGADFVQGFHFGHPEPGLPDADPGEGQLARLLAHRAVARLAIA